MSVSRPSDSSWFYFLLLVANFLSFSIQNRVPSGLKHFGLAVRFSSPSVSRQFLQEGICHKKKSTSCLGRSSNYTFFLLFLSLTDLCDFPAKCATAAFRNHALTWLLFFVLFLWCLGSSQLYCLSYFLHSVHFWNTSTLKLDLCAIRQRRIALNEC